MRQRAEVGGVGPVIIDNPSLSEVWYRIKSESESSALRKKQRTVDAEQRFSYDTSVEEVQMSLRRDVSWNHDGTIGVRKRPVEG